MAETFTNADAFTVLGIAVGLGLLVGLQRQVATDEIAGIRTFPILTVLGALVGLLFPGDEGGVVMAGFVALALLFVAGNYALAQKGTPQPGMTTEIAAMAMFLVGLALARGMTAPAVVVAGGITVLLHWKAELHAFVQRIGNDESAAIVRLVLIGLVVLPVLPDRAFGTYGVLNPFRIWLMVVLIVGISLAAYTAYRFLGPRGGTFLAGVLGGLISSTATTVGYAQQSRAKTIGPGVAATVVMIASTIVLARVLLEIGVVHAPFLRTAGPPLGLLMAAMIVIAARGYFRARNEEVATAEHEVPSDLRAAIVFGLLYAVILFAVAWTKEQLGDQGLYAVAALSGLTDMDAITLSITELVKVGRVEASEGWRLIMTGGLANLVFKGGVVVAIGDPSMRRRVLGLFGLSLLAGVLILVFWGGGSGLVS